MTNEPSLFKIIEDKLIQFKLLFSFFFIGTFSLILFQFFPNNYDYLAHDFTYFFPNILDGAFWFHKNGLFEVPWFTPSFGGGLPKFANPQGMYYSVPQFLSFVVNPMLALKITIVLFGTLGYIGFYKLLRSIFSSSVIGLYFSCTSS